jgi:hypothetical protein
MLESELLQFQFIIGERTVARLELDRVLIRGHVPERYQAVQAYVQALDRCIAELEGWGEAVRCNCERIEMVRVLSLAEGRNVFPLRDAYCDCHSMAQTRCINEAERPQTLSSHSMALRQRLFPGTSRSNLPRA